MVTEIATLSEFNKCIEDNPKVAVDFTATWCGPCKMIGPVFKAAAADYPDIKCIIVDVDENSDTSKKYGVSAMPTFKFFHNGNEVEDLCLVGASEDKLKGNFEKLHEISSNIVTEIATLSEFNKCIQDNQKVAVDFTATWCGPCRLIGPKFVAAAADYPDIKCIKVDVDENSDTSKNYGISAMPTFKFYHNGNEVENLCLVGASEDKLRANFKTLNEA